MDTAFPTMALHDRADWRDGGIIACARTGTALTRPDLDEQATALARGIKSLRLRNGDTVAFQLNSGLEFYPLAEACLRLGLALVRLDGIKIKTANLVVRSDASADSRQDSVTLDELKLYGRENAFGPTPVSSGMSWAIRKLRTPLSLLSPDLGAAVCGEVVIRSALDNPAECRTGDIGWLDGCGGLVLEGKLSDIAVRDGRAVLLSDVDTVLRRAPGVRASVTFLEHGIKPTEPVISAVATDDAGAGLRAWLAERVGAAWIPDRIVTMPKLPDVAEPVPALRRIVSGEAAASAVAALTARRFRRSPCYKEPELRNAIQAALMSRRPLQFLMFWGCGRRAFAAGPDHMAIEALGDLLRAVEEAAPIEARVDIVFTDGHATNNGHSISHYRSYFHSVEQAAAHLNASFRLESDVWRRGDLSKEMVSALERAPEFKAKWDAFALRDRFLLQASRHSAMADRVAAARHYYATCLLEREVLKAQYENAVFLTYNGPEFNECFPDLPTLYVYPGPRGRTDKPWFVHDGEDGFGAQAGGLAVAAE